MIMLLFDDGTPSSATEMAMGVMSLTSKRAWRLPVTHTLEPPSMRVLIVSELQRIVIEDVSSPLIPHTRGVQRTWVTLSIIVVEGVGLVMSACMSLSNMALSGVESAS